jgi:hypothetical protein
MNPYTYTISLGLRHPNASLEPAHKKLIKVPGLISGHLMDIGQKRTDLKGNPLDGVYRDSRDGFSFPEYENGWISSDTKPLPVALNEIIERLLPYKDVFNDVNNSGGESYLMLGLGIDRMSGETFSPKLFQSLAELNLALELHFYPQEVVA